MKSYEEMSDFEINKLVALSLFSGPFIETQQIGTNSAVEICDKTGEIDTCDYCNDPSDAWPIIVENKISINHDIARYSADSLVYSKRFDDGFKIFRHEGKMGDTSSRAALRAAMICFLKMKDAES